MNIELQRAFNEGLRPPDRKTPWEWCEENVKVDPTSPFQGLWKSDVSPWVRPIMETFADPEVSQLTIMCSAQSAKTQTLICLMTWALSQEPAPAMWVTSNGSEASYFMKTRMTPTIQNCAPLARQLLPNQYALTTEQANFLNASLMVTGAVSPSKLQSKPVRWLFLDEVRNYPEGALEMVQKRTRAYWNSKQIIVSTPDMENDGIHRSFLEGNQYTYHYECPKCGDMIPLMWGDLKWSDECKQDGVYDFDKLSDTIHLVCTSCKHELYDKPDVRDQIANKGEFIALNPLAPSSKISYYWNALLPPWVKWRDLVEEFLSATTAIKNGNAQPLKDFINESAGEPWKETMTSVDDDTIDHRRGDYTMGDEWADEFTRFMAVDVQGGGGLHYWYCIRAFAKEGASSRLIAYGKAYSETELLEIAVEHKIPAVRCIIDCGWNTASVIRFCQRHNWKPFRGDKAKQYTVRDKKTGKAVKQIWTETWADAEMGTRKQGLGKRVKRYVWSNDATKNILQELMGGTIGTWTIPKNTPQEYIQQLTSEIREEKKEANGRIAYIWRQIRRDNHLRDCELMIVVASLATRQLGYDSQPIDSESLVV